MKLLFVTGGVRSGKSRFAEQLSEQLARKLAGQGSAAKGSDEDGSVLYVATARALDEEMERRIWLHQQRRPVDWGLLESPDQLPSATGTLDKFSAVLIDSLTSWISNRLLELPEQQQADLSEAQRILQELMDWAGEIREASGEGAVILVSDEVGLGGVAMSPLGRRFQDLLGEANQRIAEQADEMYVLFSGIPLKVKG
jgi:adenosylcobinamide kinase/adenosylcobinamide-phosphate guanylyltransferase